MNLLVEKLIRYIIQSRYLQTPEEKEISFHGGSVTNMPFKFGEEYEDPGNVCYTYVCTPETNGYEPYKWLKTFNSNKCCVYSKIEIVVGESIQEDDFMSGTGGTAKKDRNSQCSGRVVSCNPPHPSNSNKSAASIVVEIIPNAKCCNYEDKATLSIGEQYLDAEVSSLNLLFYIVI